jgi:hypothetical protein
MMVFSIHSSTNMNDARVFLVDQSWGENLLWRNHWEIEMKLGIYVPINVGTLMSIGNDRQ